MIFSKIRSSKVRNFSHYALILSVTYEILFNLSGKINTIPCYKTFYRHKKEWDIHKRLNTRSSNKTLLKYYVNILEIFTETVFPNGYVFLNILHLLSVFIAMPCTWIAELTYLPYLWIRISYTPKFIIMNVSRSWNSILLPSFKAIC